MENAITETHKKWAMACHLAGLIGMIFLPSIGNIIAPLVVWIMKKEESAFIDDQGKEALNFQISMTIYLWVSGLLCFLFIGFLILPVLGIFALIVSIIAIIKSVDGEEYRYPLTIRFIK